MKHFDPNRTAASATPVDGAHPQTISEESARGAFARLAKAILGYVRRSAQARRHRREMMILLRMNDRMLKDINVTRDDVLAMAARSLSRRRQTTSGAGARRGPMNDG